MILCAFKMFWKKIVYCHSRMGCSHDRQGDSACEAQDPADQSYFIMAPYVHLYTTKWSTCSRGFITALFE